MPEQFEFKLVENDYEYRLVTSAGSSGGLEKPASRALVRAWTERFVQDEASLLATGLVPYGPDEQVPKQRSLAEGMAAARVFGTWLEEAKQHDASTTEGMAAARAFEEWKGEDGRRRDVSTAE